MKRFTIRLEPRQLEWLKAEAAREGVSVSEIARRLIERAPEPRRSTGR
ncbi:MAG: ribbon-helix-helix protein, CopG family [Actinomycetota bacterium]